MRVFWDEGIVVGWRVGNVSGEPVTCIFRIKGLTVL
jgi:hypothetical protein